MPDTPIKRAGTMISGCEEKVDGLALLKTNTGEFIAFCQDEWAKPVVVAVNHHAALVDTLRELLNSSLEAINQEAKGRCCMRCNNARKAAADLLDKIKQEAAS